MEAGECNAHYVTLGGSNLKTLTLSTDTRLGDLAGESMMGGESRCHQRLGRFYGAWGLYVELR